MKILFIDLKNKGHHFFYNYNVMKINNVKEKIYLTDNSIDDSKESKLKKIGVKIIKVASFNSKSRLINFIDNIKVLLKIREIVKVYNINVAMLLHIDHTIIPLYVIELLLPIKCEVIGTLHWFPNRYINLILLKKLCDKGLHLIVHTEDVINRLYLSNIKNVKLINYPTTQTSNLDKIDAEHKLRLELNYNVKTILYFGGTRTDKGLDILLEALCKVKCNLNVLIVGKEESFKRCFIESQIAKLSNKSVYLNLDYIEDEYVELYFKVSDIVILPYRKIFNGESGILIEAINNKNIVILPNIIHFPNVIKKYLNGILYEAENTKDLAEKIEYVIDNITLYENGINRAYEDYKEKHSLNNFTKQYEEFLLYEKWKDC